jgi:hypothetical protein
MDYSLCPVSPASNVSLTPASVDHASRSLHFGPRSNVVMTCMDDGLLEQGYRCVVLAGSDVQATQRVETSESCIWVLSIA